MVVPAMQLASKIPDMSVQLWSSALLRGELGLPDTAGEGLGGRGNPGGFGELGMCSSGVI